MPDTRAQWSDERPSPLSVISSQPWNLFLAFGCSDWTFIILDRFNMDVAADLQVRHTRTPEGLHYIEVENAVAEGRARVRLQAYTLHNCERFRDSGAGGTHGRETTCS